jgi:hypothetical protein
MGVLERPVTYGMACCAPAPGEVTTLNDGVGGFGCGSDGVVGVDDQRREEMVAAGEVSVDP